MCIHNKYVDEYIILEYTLDSKDISATDDDSKKWKVCMNFCLRRLAWLANSYADPEIIVLRWTSFNVEYFEIILPDELHHSP